MESRRGKQTEPDEQKDETFMSLLSSQRRLLSEISSGGPPGGTIPGQRHQNRPPYGARLSGELVHNRMNQPIFNHPSNEISYSKSSSTDRLASVEPDPGFTFASFESKASELMGDGDVKVPAKRAPSLGLGHSLSFLDSDNSRRGSMSSQVEDPTTRQEEDGEGEQRNEEDENEDDLSSIEPLDYKYDLQPTLLINELLNLDQSMARSQESQLTIQNWDKQMGLKRSHSKTMRLSSRSRKKVRAFLKREISSVSQQPPPPPPPPEGSIGV